MSFTGSHRLAVLILSSVAGIFISSLILSHLLKKDNALSKKLCSIKGRFDCDKVLSSKAASISKIYSWGDISLIYFIALSLFLLVMAILDLEIIALQLLYIPFIPALVASLLSLVYQWRMIRSWCIMCLITSAVIWMQSGILLFYIFRSASPHLLNFTDPRTMPAITIGFFCICLSSTWLLIKPLLILAGETINTRKRLRIWKQNPALFTALLSTSPAVDDTIWENDFVLGNRQASLQLTVAMSLLCPSCKREYTWLRQLLQRHASSLKIVIRFSYFQHKRDSALPYILDHYLSANSDKTRLHILDTWFEKMNLAHCKKILGSPASQTSQQARLQQYNSWFTTNHIQHTPAIYLNGRLLPKPSPFSISKH